MILDKEMEIFHQNDKNEIIWQLTELLAEIKTNIIIVLEYSVADVIYTFHINP